MSVTNDSLDMKPTERKPDAPEIEYKAASQDSLSMFFAAIGGAVLGTLATLLILALINGGTLNFTHPERLAVLEASAGRINENVGAVSQNVDQVAQQVASIRTDVAKAQAQVDQAMSDLTKQGQSVSNLQGAMTTLAATSTKFDTFVAALDQALASVKKIDAGAADAAAGSAAAGSAAAAGAAAVPALSTPAAAPTEGVKPGDVAVLFFVDANGNGKMDDSEANLVGLQLAVKDAAGKTLGTYVSTDGGVLVQGLKPGAYQFVVEDTAGHKLATANEIPVTVPADAKTGQAVYVPVAAQ